MDTEHVRAMVARFVSAIAAKLPSNMDASRVARALRELYAARTAGAILAYVRRLYPKEVEVACNLAQANPRSSFRSHLPSPEAARKVYPRLLEAITLNDGRGAVNALEEMGVLELCSSPEQEFGRLEFCVGCVIGRPRLIPLIELAMVAAEMGACDKATSYLADAYALAPEPPELHDLHTVAGVVALAAGKVEEAREYLDKSVRVCLEDEYARLMCSVRSFNLILAEELLDHGEASAVLKYLAQCQRVWIYGAKQIGSWIGSIQNGEEPDFRARSIRNALDEPAAKIHDLTVRSIFLTETSDSAIENPNKGHRANVGDARSSYKRDIAAAMKGKLGTNRN
jgi:tetratricopeptide (TPR) repeat protein